MTIRNTMTAFAITVLAAWSQLGGVAHAQHEPVRAERAVDLSAASPTHHHPVELDRELHLVHEVPHSSRGPRIAGGVTLIVLGVLGMAGSAVLAIGGEIVEHPICLHNPFSEYSSPCPGHNATGWWIGSGVSLGVGVISLVAGIALVALHDARNAGPPPVRVAIAPTEGGAFGTVAVDF